MKKVRHLILYWQKRHLRKQGLQLHSIKQIGRKTQIHIELPASLGRCRLDAHASIGAHTYIRGGSIQGNLSIGRYCSIGDNVTLGQHPQNHPIYWASTHPLFSKNYQLPDKNTVIGNDVWIADNAVIMAGVTIADGAVIGINSVVTKDVAAYSVVAGIPAKHIKYRFDHDTITQLLLSQWWQLSTRFLQTIDFSNVQTLISACNKAPNKDIAAFPQIIIKNQQITCLNKDT